MQRLKIEPDSMAMGSQPADKDHIPMYIDIFLIALGNSSFMAHFAAVIEQRFVMIVIDLRSLG